MLEIDAPEGVICLPLDEAMRVYGVFLRGRLAKRSKEDDGEGLFLYVPPHMDCSLRIKMGEDAQMQRIICYVGGSSRCQIKQHFSKGGCNAHFDAALESSAELTLKTSGNPSFQEILASLKRESKFTMRLYSEGSSLSKTSIKVQLLEEQSEALLQGISKLSGQNQHNIDVLVSHLAPHTRSRQHFKALVRDMAKSSFEGKIYVHPVAQKTEAYQLSNNLLLGDQAVAHAKPNLEIFADDVKASHGATFKQMDAEELFYLRSRGIPAEEAKICLVESFCQELQECIP